MYRDGAASETKVQTGTYFKNSGIFVAPFIGVGMRLRNKEFSVFAKAVNVFSGEKNDNIDAFTASYGGISYGISF